MAKKKKEQTIPVSLSNEELVPSVIGVINEKEKSNWILILIFILLIGFIVALPTITNFISGERDVEEQTTPNNPKPSEGEDNPTEEVTFYQLSDSVKIDGMVFENFHLGDKSIEFQIMNHSEVKNYLATHKLYLELYDSNKMLLQRIKIDEQTIDKGKSVIQGYDLNVNTSRITQFTLEEKSASDYPAIDLKKENENVYSLTCTKNTEKLVYEFDKEQKLVSIADTFNYSSNQPDYTLQLTDYRQMSSKYNAVEGVTSNISEVSSGFTVITNIDLKVVDFTNRTVQNTLDNKAYYGKDTEGKVVYFELSAMNYKCSM